MLHYKYIAKSIYLVQEASLSFNTILFDLEKSGFWDSYHKNIVLICLKIIENIKLRKFLIKFPNYREPRSKNFTKVYL